MARRIDGEAVEGDDRDVDARMFGDRLGHLLEQRHARLGVEQRLLAVVDADTDDELVDHPRGARDDVEMPVGDGVEGAGIESCAGHGAAQ